MSFNKFFCLLAIMFLIDSIPSVALADPYCKDGNKSGENSLTSFEESFGYLLRDISGHFENAKLEPTNDSSVDVSELLALLGEQGFFAGNDPDKFTYGQSLFQKALNDVSRKNGEKGEIRVFNFANDQKTPISWSLSHINENGEEEIFLIFKNRSDSALSAIKWRANIVLAKVPEKTTKEWSLQDQLKQARWTSLSKLKPPASTEVHFISAKEEDNNEQISAIKPSPLRQLLNEAEENSSLKKEIRNADGELIALQLRYHSEKDLHGAIRIIEHTFKDDPRTKRVAGTTTLSLTGDMGLSASIIGSLEHITSQGELDEKTKKMNEDYAVIEQNLASREFIDAVIMVLGAGTQVGVKEGKYPEWEQLKARYPLRMVGQNPALAPDAMAAVREGVETFLGYQNFSKRHLTSAQESTNASSAQSI